MDQEYYHCVKCKHGSVGPCRLCELEYERGSSLKNVDYLEMGRADRECGAAMAEVCLMGITERDAYMRGFTGRRKRPVSRGRNCESRVRRCGGV